MQGKEKEGLPASLIRRVSRSLEGLVWERRRKRLVESFATKAQPITIGCRYGPWQCEAWHPRSGLAGPTICRLTAIFGSYYYSINFHPLSQEGWMNFYPPQLKALAGENWLLLGGLAENSSLIEIEAKPSEGQYNRLTSQMRFRISVLKGEVRLSAQPSGNPFEPIGIQCAPDYLVVTYLAANTSVSHPKH